MINHILSIFDQSLHEKCWIEKYGRLAITGKQKIGDRWKRFPLSTDVITDQCDVQQEHLTTLVPDDTKKGVAFWKSLSKIKYSKITGISSSRKLKKAEAILEFVCWVNVRKASAVNDSSNWGDVLNGIIKDAIKTIDCKNPILPTWVPGLSNLRIEITDIGDIESWRRAMAEYTIDNIEAVSVWPFAGFTITCKLSFIVKSDCFEVFDCSTEFDTTGFCPPEEPPMMVTIIRKQSSGELDNYPHYFPLSLLGDDFWNITDGVIKVFDHTGNEIPCQVIGLDIPGKTGSLFFRSGKIESARPFQIQYNPGMTPYSSNHQMGSTSVWIGFDDVILHDLSPNYLFTNHRYDYMAGVPVGYGALTPAPGLLEMQVPQFGDGFFTGIPAVAWRQEFANFSSAKTYFCAFKATDTVPSVCNLFSNCINTIDGVFKVDLINSGGDYGINITTCQSGATTIMQTLPGEFSDFGLDNWFVIAIKYEAGADGVEVDINGISRALDSNTGSYPTQPVPIAANYYPRTGVIDELSGSNNLVGLINPVWVYNGALTKVQRDVFWRNWADPGGFWTI